MMKNRLCIEVKTAKDRVFRGNFFSQQINCRMTKMMTMIMTTTTRKMVEILNGHSGKTPTPSVPCRSISEFAEKHHTVTIFSGRRGQGWSTQFLAPFTRWAANAKPNHGGRACPGLPTTVVAACLLGPAVPGQTAHIARSMAEFIRRKWDQIGRRIAPT